MTKRVWGAVAAVVIGSSAGCRSVYHDARDALPPDPGERVDLRLREAAAAAEEAAGLADVFAEPRPRGGAETEPGIALGRLEAAAWELDRRMLSLQDSLAAAPAKRERRAAAIQALETANASLAGAVERLRGAGPTPGGADAAAAAADLRKAAGTVRATLPGAAR